MAEGDSAATEFASTTAGLQAAIDFLAGGKGKVFVGPGTLSVTAALTPVSNSTIEGSGKATVLAVSGAVGCFSLSSLSGVRLANFSVDCAAQSGTPVTINLSGCAGCVVEDVSVSDARNEAILVQAASSRNIVRNCTVTHPTAAGTRGIMIYDRSSDNVIEDCKVYDQGSGSGHYGIQINANSHRNLISRCYVSKAYQTGIEIRGATSGSGCNDNIVSDCICDQCGRDGASPGFGIHYYCLGNAIIGCVARKTGLSDGDPLSESGYEIQNGCHFSKIIGCTTWDAGGYGIHFELCDYVAVEGCQVLQSGDPGLRLENSYHARLTGNHCQNNVGGGIRLRNLSTDISFQAADFSQVGSSNTYKSTNAQINHSGSPVVRAEENGGIMLQWPAAAVLSADASAATTLTVVSSASLSAGDTVAVADIRGYSRQAATTVSSVPNSTSIVVAAAVTAEAGDRVLKLNSTDLGVIDGAFYIDRPGGALYVMLSDKTSPANSEVTAGAGCKFATIQGNNCVENGLSGILLEGSSYCVVSGNTCVGNGTLGSGASESANLNGIHLRDGDGNEVCNYNMISGNNCSELRPSSPTDTRQQLYGIRTEDANCDFNNVVGNIAQGNKTGTVSFQTAGSNVSANNLGA